MRTRSKSNYEKEMVDVKVGNAWNAYEPFVDWKWKSYDGDRVVSLDEFIESKSDRQFFIGTDSQNHGLKTKFTTVLVAYQLRLGGSIIMHSQRLPLVKSLRQKLLMEAMMSLDMAWYLDKKIGKEQIMAIHLDVNKNLKWKSSKYKDEMIGMIVAQGYNAVCKPDGFAASKCADKKTK